MALSNNVKNVMRESFTDGGASSALATAVDANTVKVGVVEATAITTTTTEATTTVLHTMVKELQASLQTSGAIAS